MAVPPGSLEPVVDVGRCVQPEVPDLVETGRQDMEQEAADERLGAHGGAPTDPGREGDGVVGDGDEAVIGDGDPVGVAAEVGEDLPGGSEGQLGVYDPVLAVDGAEEPGEGTELGEVGSRAVECEESLAMRARVRREPAHGTASASRRRGRGSALGWRSSVSRPVRGRRQ
jgi:hypothetical protein